MEDLPLEIIFTICKESYEGTCRLSILNNKFYNIILELFGDKNSTLKYFCHKKEIVSTHYIEVFYIDKKTNEYQNKYTRYNKNEDISIKTREEYYLSGKKCGKSREWSRGIS